MLTGHSAAVRSVAFSSDAALLASGSDDNTVRLWDADTGAPRGVLTGSTGSVRSVAFSPDGTQLASAGEDNAVRLWDLGTKTQTTALTGPTNTVADIAFNPDGHTLVSADDDATIGLWNIPAPPTPGNTAVTSVASGTGHGSALVTTRPNQQISLWDPRERVRTTTFGPAHGSTTATTTPNGAALPTDIAVSPDGTTLLTSGTHGATLWDTTQQSPVCTLPTPAAINAVAFRPATTHQTTTMVAAGSENDDIYLWPGGTCDAQPTVIPTNQFGPITTIAFSPDGAVLAAGSNDGTILLERVGPGADPSPTTLSQSTGHFGPVTSIAFSPDGRTLASGSDDGRITLWDMTHPRNPTTIATLPTPDETVISMSFSSDGATLASSADNHTISLWNTRTPAAPRLLAVLTGLTNASDVVFQPDSHTVTSATADGTPLFWDTNPDDIATNLCTSPAHDAARLLAPYLTGVTYETLCPAQ